MGCHASFNLDSLADKYEPAAISNSSTLLPISSTEEDASIAIASNSASTPDQNSRAACSSAFFSLLSQNGMGTFAMFFAYT